MPIINTDEVLSVTLYTGEQGQESCICKCPCCSQSVKGNNYHGTESQIDEFFEKLPSLEQVYILGNPDPAVDPDFCNLVAHKAINRGIHVSFCTSGVGGKKTLQRLLDGLEPSMVDYVSFSIDSTSQERMSMLKGIYYPWDYAVEGICWAIKNGYTVKVQPTLWSSNYLDAGGIIDYFAPMGVKWFTFHIGSLESGIKLPTHRHLRASEISLVHDHIDDAVKKHPGIKVRCPIIYPTCGDDDKSKYYCMYTHRCKELLVTFAKDGIMCTHAPIASSYDSNCIFKLGEVAEVAEYQVSGYCPLGGNLVGNKDTITYCRFVSKMWNY